MSDDVRETMARELYEYQGKAEDVPWDTLAWPDADYKASAFEAIDCILAALDEAELEIVPVAVADAAQKALWEAPHRFASRFVPDREICSLWRFDRKRGNPLPERKG